MSPLDNNPPRSDETDQITTTAPSVSASVSGASATPLNVDIVTAPGLVAPVPQPVSLSPEAFVPGPDPEPGPEAAPQPDTSRSGWDLRLPEPVPGPEAEEDADGDGEDGNTPPPAADAAPSKRARNERQFLPAVLEITETPASPAARVVALLLAAFFVIALGWAWIGSIDIVAVAQGKLVPTGQVKTVQPSETGIVRAIHVQNGQAVVAGEVLIELDPTDATADRDRLSADRIAAELKVARLSALLANLIDPGSAFSPPAGAPDAQVLVQWDLMQAQAAEYAARLAELDRSWEQREAQLASVGQRVSSLNASVPVLSERVAAYRQLAEQEYVARTTYLQLEQERLDRMGELASSRHDLSEARAALAGAVQERRRTVEEFRRGLLDELATAEQAAEGARQELIKADQRQGRQLLTAPVDGVVQQLTVHTKGGVVNTGDPVLIIVPGGQLLEVEASVLNKDVGFVAAGQIVEVKLEAFPFTRYGTIHGELMHISRDAVQDEQQGLIYQTKVALDRQDILVDGRRVDLAAGMSATVEIKTGKRPIIEFLLAPLFRYRDEGLRER